MGTIYDKARTFTDITPTGSLYERAQTISKESLKTSLSVELPILPKEKGFLQTSAENISGLFRGEVPIKEVVKEIPAEAKKLASGFVNTFVPAITNFFKTTGSIVGEGLAYATDKNVREQYQAGNLDILPTITETTSAKLAKATIAAGIETAVYRSFPQIAQMKIAGRGGVGALQGVGFAIAEGLAHDKSPEEIIKSLPSYGIGGAIIGALTPYLMPLLKSEIRALPNEIKNVFKGLKEEIIPTPPKKISVTTETPETTRVPISTPNSRYETYLRSQGYEPYISTEKLPIIEAGVKPRSVEPIIQIGDEAKLPTPAGTRLVPERPQHVFADEKLPRQEIAPKRPTEMIEPTTRAEEPIIQTEPEKRITRISGEHLPISGDGETRMSRLEARVRGIVDDVKTEQRATEEGIETYQQIKKPEQIRKATEYVEKNPTEALAVLRGEKPAPVGLLNNSIALVLEEKAATAIDANLALKLASLRSTRAGQEISILTEAKPDNPISAIQEIIKARIERAQRKLKVGETVEKQIAKETKEASIAMSKERLQSAEAEKLLNEIVC